MSKGTPPHLVIFGIVCACVVFVGDLSILSRLLRQWQSTDFEKTAGVITKSQVIEKTSSKRRKSYDLVIQYSYSVAGHNYQGSRYRFDALFIPVHQVAKDFPSGRSATVYFDPKKPAEAVLSNGINGRSLLAVIFLIPFNVLALTLTGRPISAWRRRRRYKETGGVNVIRGDSKIRIQLMRVSPFWAAVTVLGVTSFIALFVLGFAFQAGDSAVKGAFGVLLFIAVVTYCWRRYRISSGKEDLVIDETESVVHLPQTHGRKTAEQIHFNSISKVELTIEERRGSKGRTRLIYEISFSCGSKITEFTNERDAREFGNWLANLLSVPFELPYSD